MYKPFVTLLVFIDLICFYFLLVFFNFSSWFNFFYFILFYYACSPKEILIFYCSFLLASVRIRKNHIRNFAGLNFKTNLKRNVFFSSFFLLLSRVSLDRECDESFSICGIVKNIY